MLLDDLAYRPEHDRNDSWEPAQECFAFSKSRPDGDQYIGFWPRLDRLRPRHALQPGVWDGASLAFCFQCRGSPDLAFDNSSHMYVPKRASFGVRFPMRQAPAALPLLWATLDSPAAQQALVGGVRRILRACASLPGATSSQSACVQHFGPSIRGDPAGFRGVPALAVAASGRALSRYYVGV